MPLDETSFKSSDIRLSSRTVEVIGLSFLKGVDCCTINNDLDDSSDSKISKPPQNLPLPGTPPRFASRGLSIAPRSARLITNSGIYRTKDALSATNHITLRLRPNHRDSWRRSVAAVNGLPENGSRAASPHRLKIRGYTGLNFMRPKLGSWTFGRNPTVAPNNSLCDACTIPQKLLKIRVPLAPLAKQTSPPARAQG